MKRFSITLRELASSQCLRNNCDNEEHSSERLRKASNSSAVAVAVAACLLKSDPTWIIQFIVIISKGYQDRLINSDENIVAVSIMLAKSS